MQLLIIANDNDDHIIKNCNCITTMMMIIMNGIQLSSSLSSPSSSSSSISGIFCTPGITDVCLITIPLYVSRCVYLMKPIIDQNTQRPTDRPDPNWIFLFLFFSFESKFIWSAINSDYVMLKERERERDEGKKEKKQPKYGNDTTTTTATWRRRRKIIVFNQSIN